MIGLARIRGHPLDSGGNGMTFNAFTTIGATTVLAASIASVFAGAEAAPTIEKGNPLRVSMWSLGDGNVEVIVTNTSRKTARIPNWQLPSPVAESNLFHISRDGEQVSYEGAMIKRGLPSAADFAILRPGHSYRTVIDLGSAYDMSKIGNYTVTFAAPLQYASMSDGARLKQSNGLPMVAQGAPIQLWIDASAANAAKGLAAERANAKKPSSGGSVVNGVSYVGCSSTQISDAGTAVNSARTYSENGKGYLNSGTTGPRYTTWFGAYTSSRYATAKQHFTDIDAAIDQSSGQVKINCGCNQSYYAYVYPTRPYEIFVCRAFWSAPNTGTDSKAGTLIHEMSHFNVVAGTDDWVYGQSGAKNLAITDPTKAVDNADSHEYFAENTPKQN
jgi:peptidyl-Lys metalloendopeptidase